VSLGLVIVSTSPGTSSLSFYHLQRFDDHTLGGYYHNLSLYNITALTHAASFQHFCSYFSKKTIANRMENYLTIEVVQ
jgi:hypothetical protein